MITIVHLSLADRKFSMPHLTGNSDPINQKLCSTDLITQEAIYAFSYQKTELINISSDAFQWSQVRT